MTAEEKREMNILAIADMLRITPYQLEFKVKKKPKGVKIIIEVTQEQMDAAITKKLGEKKVKSEE